MGKGKKAKKKTAAIRNYKDSVFKRLFSDKTKLAEVYNAINGTNYTADDITLVTLNNIIFIGRENDISFTIEGKLIVFADHQASVNPNMPLRFLFYAARSYLELVENEAIYSSNLIKIPPPEFIVLYNGKDEYPAEKELKLSDAFINPEIDNLELKVKVYNINKGQNQEIMEKSATLSDYSTFIARVRENEDNGFERSQAIEKAVKDCIQDNILKEFLLKYGSDVVNMLNVEFNLADAQRVWKNDGIMVEKERMAEKLLDILDIEIIAEKTELSVEKVLELKEQYEQRLKNVKH
ncbi:MAG: hypothetical protein FWH24_04725 [Oscillospiraceae bacterium]|nr:hypothetical protein [Oscillospiraceae bacterium]